MAIFNTTDLKKYIERIELNKELLDISPMFSEADKISLHKIYDEQLLICNNTIELEKVATQNATKIEVVEPCYL